MRTKMIPLENKKFHDLNPVDCGEEVCVSGHGFGPHIRDYYLIHYVLSGKGVLKKDKKIHPVEKGEAFLIKPGEVTTYVADRVEPWHYIWIGFNGRLAERFDHLEDPVLRGELSIFLELMEARTITAKEEFLAGKLFMIYATLFGKSEDENLVSLTVRQAKSLIRSNYMKQIKIEELAAIMGINRRYLSRRFKEKTGLSLKEFLTKTRLDKAKELLSQKYKCLEVAAMVGYNDPLQFSKAFYNYFGVYPSEYKKNVPFQNPV